MNYNLSPSLPNTAFDYFAIIDPVCNQQHGHNFAALNRYLTHCSRLGHKVEAFAGKSLPLNCTTGFSYDNISPTLSHYYSKFIPLRNLSALDAPGRLIQSSTNNHAAHEIAQNAAADDLLQIVKKAAVHKTGALFYPSIDYYSLEAISKSARLIISKNIRLFIRLIGVLETTNYLGSGEEDFWSILEILSRSELSSSIIFTAECEPLAQRVEAVVAKDITVTPTLIMANQLPQSRSDIFTFCFPGSARIDKGFDLIPSILNELDSAYPSFEYRVYAQSLPPAELEHYYRFQKELLLNPRVRLYPASVSEQDLISYIEASHLIVLPYDQIIYKYRSSAMLAEAACYGRPVIAHEGCGFSYQVHALGIGETTQSNPEVMAKAIVNNALISSRKRQNIAARAREAYMSYTKSQYDYFFKSIP